MALALALMGLLVVVLGGCADHVDAHEPCPPTLDRDDVTYSLGACARWIDDPAGTARLDQLTRDAARPIGVARRDFGFPAHPRWMTVDVVWGTTGTWQLELAEARPQRLDVYRVREGAPVAQLTDGYRVAPGERAGDGPRVHLPLDVVAGQRETLWVRADASSLSLELVPPRVFARDAHLRDLFVGAYLGVAAALCAYNLFLWWALRDATHAIYVAHVAGVALFQIGRTGLLNEYVVPASHPLGFTGGASVLLEVAIACALVRRFLEVDAAMPKAGRALGALAWLSLCVGVAGLLGAHAVAVVVVPPIVLATVLATGWVGARRAWQGHSPARYFVAGWASLCAAATLHTLRSVGAITWPRHSGELLMVAIAFEAVAFSLVLAERVRLLRRERFAAFERAARSERDALDTRLAAEEAQREMASNALARHIETQEAERSRFAKEIHDGLGQQLLALRRSLSVAQSSAEPTEREALDKLVALSDTAIEDAKRIAYDLHPSQLDQLGLLAAIEACADELCRSTAIAIEVHVADGVEAALGPRAIHTYRIAQEAVTNAVRHGNPRFISVDVGREARTISLRIFDDGRGFDPTRPSPTASLGLVGMRERATLLGADLVIRSRPGEGTELSVDIPA